jgi:hypothetical protein
MSEERQVGEVPPERQSEENAQGTSEDPGGNPERLGPAPAAGDEAGDEKAEDQVASSEPPAGAGPGEPGVSNPTTGI